MICKNDLCALLEKSLAYVLGEKVEDLEPIFNKAIEDNKTAYQSFVMSLNSVKEILKEDLEFFLDSDPAATSTDEIKLAYPGFKAIAIYRISHVLYKLGYTVHARYFSELAHSQTGIDIHPAAQIGHHFTIDHGTGVVIGATAIIGNNVKLYQGVTLGALSFPLDENGNPIKGIPRHPILEDDVIVYSNATILGRITIGKGSVIGANQWITQDVAPQSKIVNK